VLAADKIGDISGASLDRSSEDADAGVGFQNCLHVVWPVALRGSFGLVDEAAEDWSAFDPFLAGPVALSDRYSRPPQIFLERFSAMGPASFDQ